MNKTDSVLIFRVMKKIAEGTLSESNLRIDRIIESIKSAPNAHAYTTNIMFLNRYVKEQSNQATLDVLLEKLENTKVLPNTLRKHNLETYEGFMDAVEEAMSEMFSGAGIGAAFDGAQSNANTNATGMAAPNGSSKKKKGIEKILSRRL